MKKTINVMVRNKVAVASKDVIYICGNSDFIINFDFDDEWNEHETKTARFIHNGIYTDVIFDGNQCAVPVISRTHNILVGVYAGNLRTTTPAIIYAKQSILCNGGSPAAPADDVYHQIMERLKKLDPDRIISWDELSGRPFGDEVGIVDVIARQTVTPDTSGFLNNVDLPEQPEVGKKYYIHVDGNDYEDEFQYVPSEFGDYWLMGNYSLFRQGEEDTGEPYGIIYYYNGGTDIYLQPDLYGNKEVVFGVQTEGIIVKQINNKYINNAIAVTAKLSGYNSGVYSYSLSATFEEIKEAVEAGMTVLLDNGSGMQGIPQVTVRSNKLSLVLLMDGSVAGTSGIYGLRYVITSDNVCTGGTFTIAI